MIKVENFKMHNKYHNLHQNQVNTKNLYCFEKNRFSLCIYIDNRLRSLKVNVN